MFFHDAVPEAIHEAAFETVNSIGSCVLSDLNA